MTDRKLTPNGNPCFCDGFKDPQLIAAIYVYDNGQYCEIKASGPQMWQMSARARKAINLITKKLNEACREFGPRNG